MSQDIFGRQALAFGGAFAADSAQIRLNLGCGESPGVTGLLTQQIGIQYSQPITRLYEIGTQYTYYVAGRPQGSANVARVLGPGSVMSELYACLGDVCNADQNDLCLCFQANCLGEGGASPQFTAMQVGLKNVVLQSLGFSIQAQDMIINEQMSLFFTSMHAQDLEEGCQAITAPDVVPTCFAT